MNETERHETEDTRCEAFETAWLNGEATRIEQFLPSPEEDGYLPTLERLVMLEMELTWEGKEFTVPVEAPTTPPPRVETYLARFPALKEREIVLRLCQQEYRLRQACGEEPTAEEYLERFSSYLENAEQVTCAATSAPTAAPSTASANARRSKHHEGQKLDQFRLVAPYAQGGFGAVWHAEDETLGRPVALKTLRGVAAEDAIARRRFVSEARVTARLEHPGIVPVHQAGRLRESDPYYTMKLVQGETLAEAIRAYHQQCTSGPTHQGLAWRRLLEAVLAVCRTMEFAHAQGVLHRDLKPQNIVLGEYGETILLDWGLAKDLFAAAPDEAADDWDTTRYDKARVMHPELVTRDGAVQGTPAYMAPEQAAGRVQEVDPRSDVYAIGAMLYQVLTGRLPFEGDSAERVLELVREEAPPAPSDISPGVPPALEAICLKAMARRREDRYDEMRLLREDLERYLAGEPVSCYREPLGTRAARWVWRHRTLTTSVLVAGLVALLALAGVAALQSASRAKIAGVNEQLEESITKAQETNEQLALSQEKLEAQYALLEEKHAALTAANDLIAGQQASGIEMVQTMLDRYYAAVRVRMQDLGINIANRPAHESGQGAEDQLGPFTNESLARLGLALDQRGRFEECQEIYSTLIAAYRYLHETFPDSLEYTENLGQAYYAAAFICDTTGHAQQAETYYDLSLEQFEELASRETANPDHQARIANVWHNQGLLQRHRDDLVAAEASYQRALATLQQLVDEHPSRWIFRRDLAATQANLAGIYHWKGDQQAAIELLEEALAHHTQLAESYPESDSQRYARAGVLLTLGSVKWVEGFPDEAIELYKACAQENETLRQRNPHTLEFTLDAGKAYLGLGQIVAEKENDMAAARAWWEQAVARFEEILERSPQHAQAAEMSLTAHVYLAEACMALEDWEAASRAWYRVDELNPGENVTYYQYQYNLSRVLAGNYEQVDKAVDALLEDTEQPEAQLYFHAAVLYSAAAAAALDDSDLTTEEAVRESERIARRSVRQLALAQELGLFAEPAAREELRENPRLEFVRTRTDFRDFLRELDQTYGED